MLFAEGPMVERIDRAAAAGFTGIEFLFPYEEDVDAIHDALERNGVQQVLFNLPSGDFAAGERGIANNPERRQQFQDGVQRALEIADKLSCSRLNCLSGLQLDHVPLDTQWKTLVENFRYAAEAAERAGVTQLVEPINTFDIPGFMITSTRQGLELIEAVGSKNLKLQYDVYHMQRMEGELVNTIRGNLDQIGHIQIADTPGRHQPGTGEINYPFVLNQLDEMGYDGWVSLEYVPDGKTEDTLSWLRDWGFWS
jgi:hydroxypyruvate isomerase